MRTCGGIDRDESGDGSQYSVVEPDGRRKQSPEKGFKVAGGDNGLGCGCRQVQTLQTIWHGVLELVEEDFSGSAFQSFTSE